MNENTRHSLIRTNLLNVHRAAEIVKRKAESLARNFEEMAETPYNAARSSSWMTTEQADIVQYGTQLRLYSEATADLIHFAGDVEEREYGMEILGRVAKGEIAAVIEYSKKYDVR